MTRYFDDWHAIADALKDIGIRPTMAMETGYALCSCCGEPFSGPARDLFWLIASETDATVDWSS